MSSDDGENFEFGDSGSESEGYAPAKKTTKKAAASKPKPAAKPATKALAKPKAGAGGAKGKAAAKKKVLVDSNDAEDSDDASDGPVAGPSKDNDVPNPQRKQKTASEKYSKLSHIDHILVRPDTYIGSVEKITQTMWVHDSDTNKMSSREITYVPGFFKIVDEILVNAADHKITDPSMDTLKVEVDTDEGTISVYNNGGGIPIEIHATENVYIPELIFGNLLAGSNFDDDEKKLTGGRNGFGAKLANIYSHEFTVETADSKNGQKYKQVWTDNMGKCGKPKITKNSTGEDWTKISFRPDLKRFGMDSIDEDTAALLRKRVYDMAGTVKDTKVWYNGKRITNIKNFKQYVELYLTSAAENKEDPNPAQAKSALIYERISNRWEIGFAVSEGSFQHVSFANSIATTKGGTHVNLIADQISKSVLAAIGKKNKGATVKAAQIKNHMWLFVNSLIENPTFDSQTKEQLTLPASKFGTKPVLSDEFTKKVVKSPIIENILNWAQFKADQQAKKTDGTKRGRLTGLPKLSDANNAGTKHAKNCTLILTEGDSAKTFAVAGLSVVGRDNFGVFPLRGKMLNVRDAKHEQIQKNEEIQNIKKIMGLQHGKVYTNTDSLRYGRLMIMTDQDHDGSHIKGLLINFFDKFYPSLLKLDDFLVEFVTPIVRARKGNQKKDFFTLPEYERWREETPGADKWVPKYYKGLGTSNDADAREEGDRELIDLAFNKKKTEERKDWLRQFKPGTFLDHNLEEIPYAEFINKELILFSMADNIRSIPSVADGLKPVQRKVMWASFRRSFKKEMRVAQLVGYVSNIAAYHHGEASLGATIINLAQQFVGSNNINLLHPDGQFGSRDLGGKDAAAMRYIHTHPSSMARVLFHPQDDALFPQILDDGLAVEPEWYLPILPLVLVNGAEGIGTGWSTNIPSFNPSDIVANIRRLMDGEEMVPMHPWWRAYTGEIKQTAKNKYDVNGVVRKLSTTSVEITELPIHKWTQAYKSDVLEAMMVGKEGETATIKEYKEHHANANVHFTVSMDAKQLEKAEEKGLLEFFKLTSKITTSNMMCFDFDGKIKKYNSPEEILEDFYPMRLAYYQKRKDYLAGELQLAFERLTNQARFVKMIVDRQLTVSNRKKADIVADLRKHNFRAFPKIKKAKDAGEDEPVVEEPESDEEEEDAVGNGKTNPTDFDYLLQMAISSLTKEKMEKLLQSASDKENELLDLLKISPKEMWNVDLDRFLVEWETFQNDIIDQQSKDSRGKTVKKKQAVLRTRKSIGKRAGGSDSEDDFKPVKAPKRKAPEPKRPAAKVKDESDDEEATSAPKKRAPAKKAPIDVDEPPKKAAKRKAISDSDSEAEEVIKKPPARKAAAKPIAIDSDDDNEGEEVSKGKGKAKAAPAKKTTAMSIDSDDEPPKAKPPAKKAKPITIDSDDDDVPKAKGKGKAAPKRKSLDSVVDSEDEPPKKKKASASQAAVTDFFAKAGPSGASSKPEPRKISKSMKPASPPKPKKAPPKRLIDSEDEDDDMYDSVPPAAAPAPSRRPARAAPKKYVEIGSDDEGETGDNSLFVDDD
ncbi:DNA topoisomerase 2 [Mycena indigotica]|uniref:DNA topoisomerase 2 n=1 Tax=Mycena indigotica TaxID=2126181 RepID=A0A8H6SYS4_9AGAR|nr:DNA topoisomerase 2 [Mycena indigotica]KAF7306385.1 DNA topoisomerase 2 [Mycena indigotica]